MSTELDEAMDAIPNLTEAQLNALIEYQREQLAIYGNKASRVAKKDQSEADVLAALELIAPAPKTGKFPRRA